MKISRPRRRGQLVVSAALLAVVLAALLFAARAPLLGALGRLAVVDDAAAPAEAILLLNGGLPERALHAAALYRAGRAPRVVLARAEGPAPELAGLWPNQSDVALTVLRSVGVPDTAIVLIAAGAGTTSTADEARLLAAYARQERVRAIVAVTSDYHTRRTRWLLRRAIADAPIELRISAAPARFRPESWWTTEEGMLAYTEELLKFVHGALVAR